MDVSNQSEHELSQMHTEKSLTLRWRSCSEWGGDRLAASSAYKSFQYIGYAS